MAFELAQHVGQAAFAFAALVAVASRELVPAEQEAHELRRRHRLDLGAQLVARVAVHACEQAAVAPLVGTGAVNAPRIAAPSASSCSKAGSTRVGAQAERRAPAPRR